MVRQLHWRPFASACVQIAVLAVLALAFFVRTPQVLGLSMAPHIASGEIVLIDTIGYRFRAPARGDIIAFRHDGPTTETYIKRIVGLPGDRVEIRGGRVFVNGAELQEPYVAFADSRSFPPVIVPPNALYVLGDNRAASDDSRFWGFVERSDVLGKAVAGIWPLGRFGAL